MLFEPRCEKTGFRGFDLGCTAIDDGKKLEISDLGSRLYYPCSENKGADQLRDLRLCFRICKKVGFLTTRLICYLVYRIRSI